MRKEESDVSTDKIMKFSIKNSVIQYSAGSCSYLMVHPVQATEAALTEIRLKLFVWGCVHWEKKNPVDIMLYNVTNNFLFPALSGAFCLCRSRPLPLYSHRISSIFSLFLYIYVHAFDVFILKSVLALKLIPSLCITDEGQTERQWGRVKVVSSKGCSSIITRESSDQQNEAGEREGESRETESGSCPDSSLLQPITPCLFCAMFGQFKDCGRYVNMRKRQRERESFECVAIKDPASLKQS